MFRKRDESPSTDQAPSPTTRIDSVLGSGVSWKGTIGGRGGVRIEGAFEGDITLHGMLVVGETGRVTCEEIRANTVIVAGALRGNITAEKVDIRSTGRVWGDVTTTAFSTEEGAFLRGNIQMEDQVDLGIPVAEELPVDDEADEIQVDVEEETQEEN